jgi:hypothetical protein
MMPSAARHATGIQRQGSSRMTAFLQTADVAHLRLHMLQLPMQAVSICAGSTGSQDQLTAPWR